MTKEEVEKNTILRGLIGSTIHGLALEGTDDRDEMGVCVEEIESVVGLGSFEQLVFRTAAEREGFDGARSQKGDLDLVIYSLKKYIRLALDGNPTITNLLYVPNAELVVVNAVGKQLQDLAPLIVSRRCAGRYLGYMQAQRMRLIGERGQKRIKRPELEEKYGYDTKYAMHMLRLGYQGIEILQTGHLSLPMAEPSRSYLMDVRTGKLDIQDILTRAGELEKELVDLKESSPLSKEPDFDAVEEWMVGVYLDHWKVREFDKKIRSKWEIKK